MLHLCGLRSVGVDVVEHVVVLADVVELVKVNRAGRPVEEMRGRYRAVHKLGVPEQAPNWTATDRKHQSASGAHGHHVAHTARRVRGWHRAEKCGESGRNDAPKKQKNKAEVAIHQRPEPRADDPERGERVVPAIVPVAADVLRRGGCHCTGARGLGTPRVTTNILYALPVLC